jgi:uncharacterized protein (DUF302 family)
MHCSRIRRAETSAPVLPLKAVAWESEDAKVYLGFNSAEYLTERHHLAGEPFKAVESLLARAVQ